MVIQPPGGRRMNDDSSITLVSHAGWWPPPLRYTDVAPLAMEREPGEDAAGLAAVIGPTEAVMYLVMSYTRIMS